MSIEIADPRVFAAARGSVHEALIRLAEASLEASSASRGDEIGLTLARALADHLIAGDSLLLTELFPAAPSAAVGRQLWRALIDAWRIASAPAQGDGVVATLFALPVVVVVGSTADAAQPVPAALSGVLDDTEAAAALLREHRALGGNLSFGLAPALVSADVLDIPWLPGLLALQRIAPGGAQAGCELHPTPMSIHPKQESVHLRFMVGTAIGAPATDLFGNGSGGEWLMLLARELSRQIAARGVSALALPRPPQTPLLALQHGRSAQREVGAQIFASNAIRRFRASVGEPSAVISAHRCATSPGGGELRLSLSSPFDPRQAEGFRCPLFAFDRAGDVAAILLDLLRDCRVSDARVVAGIQPDRDPATGMILLFKADAIPRGETVVLH